MKWNLQKDEDKRLIEESMKPKSTIKNLSRIFQIYEANNFREEQTNRRGK